MHHWYREILGRDPSSQEVDFWVENTDYDASEFGVAALKTTIQGLDEKEERVLEVNAIKDAVKRELTDFLELENTAKEAYAEALGLEQDQLIALTLVQKTAIETWIDEQGLHFGQSAFIALESLLKQEGKTETEIDYNNSPSFQETLNDKSKFSRYDLAVRLILMDILAGIITPLDSSGELIISMYAMRRVLQLYETVDAQGLALTYSALKASYEEACANSTITLNAECDLRLVAHIDGNHYIILTGITLTARVDEDGVPVLDDDNNVIIDEVVTYIDPGMGPEENLEHMTLTKDEFIATWVAESADGNPENGFGYVLSPRPPPQSVDPSQIRVLNTNEEMQIRGAFFGFIFKVFKSIWEAIKVSVLTLVNALESIVIGTINSIKTAFLAIGNIFTGIFTGDFSQWLGGLKDLFITSGLEFFQGIAGAISEVYEGMAQVLVAFGVSEEFARDIISGAKIVGGVVLTAVGVFTVNPALIGMGISLVGSGTTEMLRRHTNLSPTVINLIGVGASALGLIAGGLVVDGNILSGLDVLGSNLHFLAQDLASAGLVALGDAIGLDPRITGLISIPVRMAVGRTVGGLTTTPGSIETGEGVLEELKVSAGLNPSEITFHTNDAYHFDGSHLLNDVIDQPNLWDGFLGALKDAAVSASNFLGPEAIAALPDLIAFNQIQQSSGYSQTLNENKEIIFDQPTLENIKNQGGVDNILNQGTTPITLPDGTTANGYQFSGTTTHIYDNEGNFIGQFKNGRYELGEFTLSDQEFVLQDGIIYEDLGAGVRTEIIVQDSRIQQMSMYEDTLNVDPTVVIESLDKQPIFIEGPDQAPQLGKNFKIEWNAVSFVIVDGKIKEVTVSASTSAGQSGGNNVSVDELYLLVNGILNSELHKAPGYLLNYGEDIITQSNAEVSSEDLILAPTFFASLESKALSALLGRLNPGVPTVFGSIISQIAQNTIERLLNAGKDLFEWLEEVTDPVVYSALAGDIKASLDNFFNNIGEENRARDIIASGYSGGFMPMSEVLANEIYSETTSGGYHATSMLAIGAATIKYEDIAVKIIEVGEAIRSGYVTSQMFQDFLQGGFINMTGSAVTSLLDYINTGNSEDAYQIYIAEINSQSQIMGHFADYDMTSTDVGIIANIYGTKDILSDIDINGEAIGGYRSELNGFTPNNADHKLFNIEIVGAAHFDYLRRDLFDVNFFSFLNSGG